MEENGRKYKRKENSWKEGKLCICVFKMEGKERKGKDSFQIIPYLGGKNRRKKH